MTSKEASKQQVAKRIFWSL